MISCDRCAVVLWEIGRLVPYSRTLRKNDDAVERMVASIREFGFKIPILARSTGEVVDGDLRLKAAKKEGMAEVPVILCDEWSEAQVKAFRLLVNRSASWAEWDLELVTQEIEEIKGLDFDLSLTGFDEAEIDDLLFREHSSPEDEMLEASEQPISKRGDLWVCGQNLISCGDSTVQKSVEVLFCGEMPVLMITDPPYGVAYDPNWREAAGLGQQRQTGIVANDDRVDWREAYQWFCGDVAYVWHAGIHSPEVAAGLEAVGFRIRAQIIWAKQHFALSRGDYHWQHEPCWYAVREGRPSHWCGDRTQSTVWQVPNLNPIGGNSEEEATGHGTQKPLELMRRPILNHTKPGEIVYDPFLGSGTTLIAAGETGRRCYAIDIDPRYVDVAVRRWQKYTGKAAILADEKRSFEEVAAERASSPVEV